VIRIGVSPSVLVTRGLRIKIVLLQYQSNDDHVGGLFRSSVNTMRGLVVGLVGVFTL